MTIFLAIVIPLLISLVSYAAILTLKHIEYRATIESLNNKLTTARAEFTSLDEKKNQEITDIIKSNETRINELTETISNLRNKDKFIRHNGLLWLPDDPVPFCQSCLEVRDKEIHMMDHLNGISFVRQWFCRTCGNSRPPDRHPNL